MNMTVMEYVNKRRLIRASEDIVSGEKVIDAAMKYGWQSHSGFTRAFTKEFHFSPSLLKAMLYEMSVLQGGNGMNHVFLEATQEGMKKRSKKIFW